MAGRPKKRAKQAGAEKKPEAGAPELDSWAADLTAQLMGTSPVATGLENMGAAQEEPVAVVLGKMAAADREFLEGWWRDQLSLVEKQIRERAELLASADSHPSPVFARQALQFGAMGIPKDVASRLLGLRDADMEAYYGHEYSVGAAQVMGQVAANLLRMATSTNDRVAVKAATEWMNRRGGEEWRPPAQKLELSRPEPKGNLIDSSKLTFEERGALRAIILRATARENAGLLPAIESESDGEKRVMFGDAKIAREGTTVCDVCRTELSKGASGECDCGLPLDVEKRRARPNIHEIKRTSFLNVPQKLKELAALIKEVGTPTAIVIVGRSDGTVSVYGYGERTSALQVSGWLARAQEALTHGSNANDTDGYQWDPPAA